MANTLNLPFARFVAQVSAGPARPKSSYLAMMAENEGALKECAWHEASSGEVSLVPHDFTKSSFFSDAYDAFKMTAQFSTATQYETAFAGMAAYRFALPVAYMSGSATLVKVALPISRDRAVRAGVRVAVELSDSVTPAAEWATVRGEGAGALVATGVLSQADVVQYVDGSAAGETVEISLEGADATKRRYLWVYLTMEDYTDRWTRYNAREARNYAIEGSAMLAGSVAAVTFSADVAPDSDALVLSGGGTSPTWLQPLPTVNVGSVAPTVAPGAEQVDVFFTPAVISSSPKPATWTINGQSGQISFVATLSLFGADSANVSADIVCTGPEWPNANVVTESTTMTRIVSGAKTYLHYITSRVGYAWADGKAARLHVYIQLPTFEADDSGQGTYRVASADAKWFSYLGLDQSPRPGATADVPSGNGPYYGTYGSTSAVLELYDVAVFYWMLRMVAGVPSEMDACNSPSESARRGLPSSVSGSASPWTVTVGGQAFAVTVSGRAVTLAQSPSGDSWDFTLSEDVVGESYFDPAVRIHLGEIAGVTDFGVAAALGDFSHAVATFEQGGQPLDSELLGRLARMSRANVGGMFYLHPASGVLADELDILRPVPRFFRAATPPSDQTSCQPGLSVWYSRLDVSAVARAIVQRDSPVWESVVSAAAFLQLTLLAVRASAAFGMGLRISNVGESAVANAFALRFVAWRTAAAMWDGSDAWGLAAMAAMPSVYRSDGPATVAWSADLTGGLMPLGSRQVSADRIGASPVTTGAIGVDAAIDIPITSPVAAGDVILIAPEVVGFADGVGAASATFGRQADPAGPDAAQHNYAWARYPENLGWFPRVVGY